MAAQFPASHPWSSAWRPTSKVGSDHLLPLGPARHFSSQTTCACSMRHNAEGSRIHSWTVFNFATSNQSCNMLQLASKMIQEGCPCVSSSFPKPCVFELRWLFWRWHMIFLSLALWGKRWFCCNCGLCMVFPHLCSWNPNLCFSGKNKPSTTASARTLPIRFCQVLQLLVPLFAHHHGDFTNICRRTWDT